MRVASFILEATMIDIEIVERLARELNAAGDRHEVMLERIFNETDAATSFAVISVAGKMRLRAAKTIPALTLLENCGGECAVTLNDYGGPDGDDVSSILVFDTRAEAEAFIAECRQGNAS
jgi:hypothetical protein